MSPAAYVLSNESCRPSLKQYLSLYIDRVKALSSSSRRNSSIGLLIFSIVNLWKILNAFIFYPFSRSHSTRNWSTQMSTTCYFLLSSIRLVGYEIIAEYSFIKALPWLNSKSGISLIVVARSIATSSAWRFRSSKVKL